MAPAFIQPNRSLFGFVLMVTFLNVVAAFLHLLDFAGGMNGGKGIILDFIGQAYPAARTRILLLDLLLYVLQETSLLVAYLSSHGSSIPRDETFDFEDLLLPPSEEATFAGSPMMEEPDDLDSLLDLEAGEGGPTRRRRSSNRAFDEGGEETGVWLDEGREASSSRTPLLKTPTTISARPRRIPDPPLIFSLPISHILRLVLYLRSPSPAPRVFSGGTPARTPPHQTTALPPIIPVPPTEDRPGREATGAEEDWEAEEGEADEEEEQEYDVLGGHGYSRRSLVSGGRGSRPSEDIGRIPGEDRPGG